MRENNVVFERHKIYKFASVHTIANPSGWNWMSSSMDSSYYITKMMYGILVGRSKKAKKKRKKFEPVAEVGHSVYAKHMYITKP